MKKKQIAEHATIQSFLNCYLRETQNFQLLDEVPEILVGKTQEKSLIFCELPLLGIHLYIPLAYWSVTGRHLFSFPIYYSGNSGKLLEVDYITLVNLITKQLIESNEQNGTVNQEELMMRVMLSCQNIEQYITERYPDIKHLYDMDMNFIDAEQALLFGHLMHPTPKSRQGISEWDAPHYSPELKGEFSLHYFRVHTSIVKQGSALKLTASEIVKQQVMEDPSISDEFKLMFSQEDGNYKIIPIHPWQAKFLMKKPRVKELMGKGLIQSLGQHGRCYFPTSSLRTVYHPEANFMLKFSLNVKVTNSVRANKYMELERGVEVKKLMEGRVGRKLREEHPNFQIICDPSFITVDIDGEKESGFEVIFRENPFKHEKALNATPLAALCQDSVKGHSSRLAEIIKQLAENEGRSTEEVSLDWFRSYLNISLNPIMWLYLNYGIAVEAHQQNSVIQLKSGYPDQFFYRDNQGYYFCQSYHQRLNEILPGISEKSHTICLDSIADERLCYYFFFNHLFGVINAFGAGGLIDEMILLEEVRKALHAMKVPDHSSSTLISSLLSQRKLPCKANLLTRFYDMDELTGSLETQSVYIQIDNPLCQKELDTNEKY
ncbi:Siderophore synthetase component [Gracilibacillus orientalis]|uniref:Siderophore synthetase component n=1 Tax=Gracilibacillus orientalis TaxID=334253 RepID=A0A1I4JTQ7_9BACI|nr:IucA/IucC family protein [Gracilibacillus orientalis]SFL69711.1 Siderophore synthetase component [Gracilibacillus orientalis]